jgi:5'-nucleotidase
MSTKMKVLLTNDDGIQAPCLQLLKRVMSDVAECFVVAPASQMSASAHAISLAQSVAVSDYMIDGVFFGKQVEGTPADCVKIALCEILKDSPPDLIISGINRGPNTGVSVFYSGTVSAAREGTIAGIPSIAASMCSFTYDDYTYACELVRYVALKVYEHGLPEYVTLNINIPPLQRDEIKGVRVTKQAHSRFIEEYIAKGEKQGRTFYELSGELEVVDTDPNNDEQSVTEGYVSITPIKLELTDLSSMKSIEEML